MSSHRQEYVRRALLQRRLQQPNGSDDDGGESRTREQRPRRVQDQDRHRLRLQGHQPQPPQPQTSTVECCPPWPKRPRIVDLADDALLLAALSDDGYRLGSTIGNGTYSKVRVALRTRPGAAAAVKLACKVIDKKRGAGGSASYLRKFLPRELDLLRRVRHPNLIRTHRIYVTPSAVHVFMEYCKHGDLLNHLQRSRGMPYWQTRTFFRQICDAVDYLHRNDISHRDIKCENVLLESMEVVKLADFGFARVCADEWGKRLMSQTYCGSSAYAAPEVLQGIPYDPKAYDVWAMGVVLYVMLTNCMPYPQSDHRQIITNQMARNLSKPKKPVNQEALKFVSIILEPDVIKRVTISQIKNHSWFLEN